MLFPRHILWCHSDIICIKIMSKEKFIFNSRDCYLLISYLKYLFTGRSATSKEKDSLVANR